MNIEEERKAYSKWLFSKDTEVSGFDTWLAAKEHDAEMAKPAVRVVYELVKSAEQENFGEVLFDGAFHSDSPEEWAHKNGYRVIK